MRCAFDRVSSNHFSTPHLPLSSPLITSLLSLSLLSTLSHLISSHHITPIPLPSLISLPSLLPATSSSPSPLQPATFGFLVQMVSRCFAWPMLWGDAGAGISAGARLGGRLASCMYKYPSRRHHTVTSRPTPPHMPSVSVIENLRSHHETDFDIYRFLHTEHVAEINLIKEKCLKQTDNANAAIAAAFRENISSLVSFQP